MIKPSIYLWLHNHIKKDGTSKLYWCVTINREKQYVATGHSLKRSEWDGQKRQLKRSADNYYQRQIVLNELQHHADRCIHEMLISKAPISFETMEARLLQSETSVCFLTFIEEQLVKERKEIAYNTWRAYKSKAHIVREIFPSGIPMEGLSSEWLRVFRKKLTDRELGEGTVHAYLKLIRKMAKKAMEQGLIDRSPFVNFKMPTPPLTKKEILYSEERQKLLDLLDAQALPSYLQQTLHYFLIACYTGLRISDWPQCRNIDSEGMLELTQTKGGGKLRVFINDRARALIECLPDDYRVFKTQTINRFLKELALIAGIDKHLTTHCARHTFVVMCLNEASMSMKDVAVLVDDKESTIRKYYAQYIDSYKRNLADMMKGL